MRSCLRTKQDLSHRIFSSHVDFQAALLDLQDSSHAAAALAFTDGADDPRSSRLGSLPHSGCAKLSPLCSANGHQGVKRWVSEKENAVK